MKNENVKPIRPENSARNDEYLKKIFSIMKMRNDLVFVDKKTRFNNTEIRLLGEIIAARCENKRLISAEIARRLGITRSAVSQIVGELERQDVLKRVPDEVDKKIAYVELSEDVVEVYKDDVSKCAAFVGSVVEEFGESKFNDMCLLFQEFTSLVSEKVKNINNKA